MTKLTHLTIENMTCFEKISFDFSNGINVFIGENGTGKTHVLKVIKSVCSFHRVDVDTKKIPNYTSEMPIFFLNSISLSSLFNSQNFGRDSEVVTKIIYNKNNTLSQTVTYYTPNSTKPFLGTLLKPELYDKDPIKNTYIPPKDITESSKGFIELNERHELNYSTIYSDILKAAFIPPLRHLDDDNFAKIRDKIGLLLGGNTKIENGEFYIQQSDKDIPFTLYSEGLRKFALLKILIENGEIAKDTALIWDEPEANLNPKMLKFMAELLLDLEQAGVQIFLSTHEEALINWLEVKRKPEHSLTYFTLYKKDKAVSQENAAHYNELKHNPIEEAAIEIFDAHMQDENGVLVGAN